MPSTSLVGLNPKQDKYIKVLDTHTSIICRGPAGTGKTYVPTVKAAEELLDGDIENIIMVRPIVPAGRTLGHLPGEYSDKVDPWMAPFIDILADKLGTGRLKDLRRRENIQFLTFETMRGRTFNDCYVILDEAQNATPREMEMFLTRLGHNCVAVICGDERQTDLYKREDCGLTDLINLVAQKGLDVPIITFDIEDIARGDGDCYMWAKAYATRDMPEYLLSAE